MERACSDEDDRGEGGDEDDYGGPVDTDDAEDVGDIFAGMGAVVEYYDEAGKNVTPMPLMP